MFFCDVNIFKFYFYYSKKNVLFLLNFFNDHPKKNYRAVTGTKRLLLPKIIIIQRLHLHLLVLLK